VTEQDPWVKRIDAIGKVGIGTICALGLVYFVWNQGERMIELLEKIADSLDIIMRVYTGG